VHELTARSSTSSPFLQVIWKAAFPIEVLEQRPDAGPHSPLTQLRRSPILKSMEDPFMSARVLTAYLVSISLVAGIISQALAKPPDLPAKVQITCDKPQLVLKTYQVADLVVPFENAPWVLPTPVPEPVKFIPGIEPAPVKGSAAPVYEVVPAPVPPSAPGFPQPFGSVIFPAPPVPVPFPVMAPAVYGLAKTSRAQPAPA